MKIRLVSLAIIGLLSSEASFSADEAHWGYSGHEGPEHWGDLDPEYSTCASGKNQSPINLTKMIEGDLPELGIDYKAGGNEVVNNGHTIQVNYATGSMIHDGDHTFELKQFHFHTPSENKIEDHSYPLEAHFVHADKAGDLAVIAVMFEPGEQNAELEKIWEHIPHEAGEKHELSDMVDANVLIPHDHAYFRYNGSLTTPPCSEGVNWYVMKYFDTASQEQINEFIRAMHHENNRPVQPVNARVVIQ